MKSKKLRYYMRCLHRDVGFFLVGLTMIYGISGIVLIYRDTDFLKRETIIEKQLSTNLEADQLGEMLHIRRLDIQSRNDSLIIFQNGKYNLQTGKATYTVSQLPGLISKFIDLHKSSSSRIIHWFSLIYGILLLFLAVSSFWMLNPKSKLFRREIFFAAAGILLSILILIFV